MITKDKVVSLTYDLYVGNEPEELMERATADAPCVYCHGRGLMLPMFEANLEPLDAGQAFDFVINHADAYGEYDDEAVLQLDKALFLGDQGKLDSRVQQFAIVPLNTVDGQIVRAQVVEIGTDKITVDLNHPLAGEDLHFVGKILEVRDATPDELKSLENTCNGCGGDCGGKCDANGCDCNA